jgi:hypothetical protein
MSIQERQAEIRPALEILKRQQLRTGKRGDRTHKETVEYRALKIIALKLDVCSECQGLIIRIARVKGRKRGVALKCEFGGDPPELHREYLYQSGVIPTCSSRILFDQEE